MDTPTEINSVYWDRKKKSWEYEMVPVEEYHGAIDCQYCNKPMQKVSQHQNRWRI